MIAGSVFLLFLGGYYYHVQVGNSLYDMQKDRAAGSHYPVTIRNSDSAGNPAEQVFTEKPRRVVTHELNTFETLICLGQGDTVIGTSINTGGTAWKRMEKMYPEEIKKVKIINRYHPDAETVVAANPDLIIGWKSTFTSVLKKPTAWWNEEVSGHTLFLLRIIYMTKGALKMNAVIWMTWDRFLMSGKKRTG